MSDPLSSSPVEVLVVDDDDDVAKAAALLLGRRGFAVRTASSPAEAWSALAAQMPDVVLLDLNFSRAQTTGAEGLEMLRRLAARPSAPAVVVVTGHSGVAVAVEAMRAGAADFVMKPWNNDRLAAVLEQAAAGRRAPARPDSPGAMLEPVGESPAFLRARAQVERAGASEAALLIHGPAGVGKSLMAAVAHERSARAHAPLQVLDAAHADVAELEARWAAAAGGALLLEQVEHLAPAVQARLLERLGPGVRLIATSRLAPDRLALGEGAQLRSELYHRLVALEVRLPTLAERPGDAERLWDHFLRLFTARHRRAAPDLPAGTREAVCAGPWPDEVRSLRRAAERAVVLGDAGLLADPLPSGSAAAPEGDMNLERSERALIERSLKLHGFNVSRAAEALGLTRAALYRRMTKHGL